MVFGFHAWFVGLPIADRADWSSSLAGAAFRTVDAALENFGVQGVALFYVISGFLLYRPFVAARAAGERGPGIGGYFIRRGLRIFPAYWAALTIIGLVQGSGGLFTWNGIWDYYLFNHIYSFQTLYGNPVPSAWTLGVELSFYLFLSLWVVTLGRFLPGGSGWFRREVAALGVVAGLSFGWMLWVLLDPATRPHAFQPKLVALPASLYVFVGGMALAALSVRLAQPDAQAGAERRGERLAELLSRYGWRVALVGLVLMAAFGSRSGIGPQDWALRALVDSTLKVVIAVGLVAPAVFRRRPSALPLRVLGSRLALYLGLVSYGIYIWQLFVMDRLFHRGALNLGLPTLVTFPAAAVLALVVTTLIASASWYLLEKRLIGWGAALTGRSGRSARVGG